MHATISDFIVDIAQNAIEADASVVDLHIVRTGRMLDVTVQDNGRGMTPDIMARAIDPFHTEAGKHPGRKVGLGLPFVKMAAEWCGGVFSLSSEAGRGTTVHFSFDVDNVDTPPMGALPDTLAGLMNYPGRHNLRIFRNENGRGYSVTREELREALGTLESVQAISMMKTFFASNEEEIWADRVPE